MAIHRMSLFDPAQVPPARKPEGPLRLPLTVKNDV